MESSAQQPAYEFTTPRIVVLVVAVVLWIVLGVAAMGRDGNGDVGYLVGTLFMSLLIAWVVRSLYRLIRRRPVIQPAWTPGLFVGAVIFLILSAAGNSAPPS